MKKKEHIKKPNLDECRTQLENLTTALYGIDQHSQNFLDLNSLNASRRLALNAAARTLKGQIIFAQTDLWSLLTAEDIKARVGQFDQAFRSDGNYQMAVSWEPKKKAARKKTRKVGK